MFIFEKKLLRILSFIFFIIYIFFSCSRTEDVDNSNFIFSTPKYKRLETNEKILLLDSLREKNRGISSTISYLNFLFDLSTEYYNINEYSKSLIVSKTALSVSHDLKDTLSVARAYYYIGDAYEQKNRDSAYYYYQKSEKLYQLLANDELRAKMLFKKASILYFEGNYIESEIQLSNALQLLNNNFNYELSYTFYNLMGCNLEKLDDFENAHRYFNLAKKQLETLNKQDVYFNEKFNYNVVLSVNTANVFDKEKKYKKSIQELNSVLKDNIEKKWPTNYAVVLGNLGYSKMKSGNLEGVEMLLKKALNLSYKYNSEADAINKLINLGEFYLIKKDTTKSRNYLNRALVLGKKIKASNELKLVYDLLSKAEPQRDSYYKGKIIRLTDSLAIVQRKNRNKYARIEYETAVVEDANKELSSKNLYLIVGVVVLVGALGVRYVIGQRKEIAYRKRLQVAEQELFDLMQTSQIELNGARQEEQNRISRELHDNVMNKLYGTRLHLGLLNTSTSPDAQEKRLEHIDELQTIENEIRAISHDLHTDSVASHFDYPVLLATCVQKAGGNGTTLFAFESAPEIDWDAISGLIKITIYRIVQEALFNVTKYADATECSITLSQPEPTSLLLTISDNGKGFGSTLSTTGIGLANMKDRTRLVKADLLIQSAPGQGTTIECKFVV